MQVICKIAKTTKDKKMFLKLPKLLYSRKNQITQDVSLEKSILNGTHCLSRYFDVTPFIVVSHKNEIFARCIVTVYPNDENAYIGFFESSSDREAYNVLFEKVFDFVKAIGKNTVVGPYNASFWLGYRLKTNHFGTPYACEPYNLSYYPRIWKEMGFEACDNYISNQYKIIPKGYFSPKYKKRLEEMSKDGYVLRNAAKESFDKDLTSIYYLLTELYSSFPAYKPISLEEFRKLYGSLKYVLDYKMVKLIFKDGKLAAFAVNIPNYGNTLTRPLSPKMLFELIRKKHRIQEYVLLYMGADRSHLGLGGSMAEIIKNSLSENGCTSVGALIHEGKVTGGYYKDLIVDKYTYSLYLKRV